MNNRTMDEIEVIDPQKKRQTLLIGGVVGGLVGVGMAYLLIQRAEKQGGDIDFSTGEAIRLGVLLLGALRQVADLASPKNA